MMEPGLTEERSIPVTPEQQRVREIVDFCLARSNYLQKSILLRLQVNLPQADPWGILAHVDPQRERFFAWHDPRSMLTIAALGCVHRCASQHSDRFQSAQTFNMQLLELSVDMHLNPEARINTDIPLAMGGFSFDHRSKNSDVWQGWDNSELVVPSVVYFSNGSTGAMLYSWLDPNTPAEHASKELLSRINTARIEPPKINPSSRDDNPTPRLEEGRAHWCERVFGARDAVQREQLDKVVLARSVRYDAPKGKKFDPIASLRRLRGNHPNAICYAIGNKDKGCFLGASPEALVRISGQTVKSEALAGTAPRGQGREEDHALGQALLQSRKDGHEHHVVVRGLREILEPECSELNVSPEPTLMRLSQVQHLETQLQGKLRQAGGVLNLVEKMHPSPALGGAPREPALDWLRREEHMDRGWYGGPIGWLTAAGDGVFAVAIRSGLIRGAQATAFAGAGIVAQSDPAKEWRETELKLRAFSSALTVC